MSGKEDRQAILNELEAITERLANVGAHSVYKGPKNSKFVRLIAEAMMKVDDAKEALQEQPAEVASITGGEGT